MKRWSDTQAVQNENSQKTLKKMGESAAVFLSLLLLSLLYNASADADEPPIPTTTLAAQQAETDSQELETEADAATRSITAMNPNLSPVETISRLNGISRNLGRRIEKLQASADTLEATKEDWIEKEVARLKKAGVHKRDKTRRKHAFVAWERAKESTERAIAAARESLTSTNTQLQTAQGDDEEEKKALELQVRLLNTTMKFQNLRLNVESIDDTLDDIERVYDQSVLGAYFQDKIGQLLNSQVFCKAARRRCDDPNPYPINPEIIRNELFPDTEEYRGSNSKNEKAYYDKVNRGTN